MGLVGCIVFLVSHVCCCVVFLLLKMFVPFGSRGEDIGRVFAGILSFDNRTVECTTFRLLMLSLTARLAQARILESNLCRTPAHSRYKRQATLPTKAQSQHPYPQ